ncbi:MAG: pilus assembly protein [Caldilineaceae bacterium]|nr:pilus assembly protein [Caldilineaceae bacterium]
MRKCLFCSERGNSLVEFALILPIFLALLLGMVDIGQGFNTYIGMLNANREGVIWLARNPADLTGMNTRIASELERVGVPVESVFVSRIPAKSTYQSGDIVTVTLEHPYPLLFGAITGVPSLTLRTEHTMRVQ